MFNLEKKYGKSATHTDLFNGKAILGKTYKGLDKVKRKLIHIQNINMTVDIWRFDDGLEIFVGDSDKYFDESVFK